MNEVRRSISTKYRIPTHYQLIKNRWAICHLRLFTKTWLNATTI